MPWSVGSSSFYESVIQAIADRYEIDARHAVARARPTSSRICFLYGTNGDRIFVKYRNRMGRKRPYTMAFEGIVTNLAAALPRDRLVAAARADRGVHELPARARTATARGSSRRCSRSRSAAARSTSSRSMSVTRALRFLDELELTQTEELIGARIVKEIRERLTFLDDVGVGYLQLDRAAKTLSGGEAQRLRLATQIGSQLVGVLYILDEPSIGLHQRDNDRLIGTLERLRDARQHRARRRARRADDARRRLARRHGPGRRRARRPGRRRGHGDAGRCATRARSPAQFLSRQARGSRSRRGASDDRGSFSVRGAVDAQPEGDRRRVPGRQVRLRHRRLRLGQVDARERDRLQGARQPAEQDARRSPATHDDGRGDRRASTR